MVKAKKEFEEAETRRFIELQKRKKIEEEQEKKRMLEILARDKEERFGKKFNNEGSEIKTNPPIDDVHYYTEAIIKLYPVFRCGTQAKDCLNIIRVAINNILKNPDEEKFRKIKMTNPTVEEKLKKIPLGMKIVKVLGFEEDGEFEVLKKEKTDIDLLKKASSYLEAEINKYNQ